MMISIHKGIKHLLGCLTVALGLCVSALGFASGGTGIPLQKAPIHSSDNASLQRGARLYMNYCMSCHSLRFMRYKRMGKDIGIADAHGAADGKLLEKNLIFTGSKIAETITNAMPSERAKEWFGVAPPDLTLIARIRGADWLYTYLRSFYIDPQRPWGVNNWLFKDVAMPHVLIHLQGKQIPIFSEKTVKYNGKILKISVIDHLKLQKPGIMTAAQFDLAMADVVNFLVYVGEPMKAHRQSLGFWVLIFLGVLFVLAFLLKKEYWKDIKKSG